MNLIDKNHINLYIPQRDPFVMVDELESINNDVFICNFTIQDDNIFLDNGCLREFALIENICQSAAAGISFTKRQSGKTFKDGFLGGIKNLKVYSLPVVGDKLQTETTILHEFENLFLIKGLIFKNKQLILECEVKLAATN